MRREDAIIVEGARENNLKGVSLSIPKGAVTVFTGVSGSGKSSMAMDTLFAEGKRRYLEASFHPHPVRGRIDPPDVDSIRGLPPAIFVGGGKQWKSPLSTMGTLTGITEFLRLLFAKGGEPSCPDCSIPLKVTSRDEIFDALIGEDDGGLIVLGFPARGMERGEDMEKTLMELLKKGFSRVIWGEEFPLIEDVIYRPGAMDRFLKYGSREISGKRYALVLTDRLFRERERDGIFENRFLDSLNLSIQEGGGTVYLRTGRKENLYLTVARCPSCLKPFPDLTPSLFSKFSPQGSCRACRGSGRARIGDCDACHGTGFSPCALSVRIRGRNIADALSLPVRELADLLKGGEWKRPSLVALEGIMERVELMERLGITYLSLKRETGTLSSGEFRRALLVRNAGASLSGILYILDEPTAGLHEREMEGLLSLILSLKDKGNTVVVIEHERKVMEIADHIVDFGPSAGRYGGEIVFSGSLSHMVEKGKSRTARYLRQRERGFELLSGEAKGWLDLRGAALHNLKGIDARFPLKAISVITGVSGAGKSSLATLLYLAVEAGLRGEKAPPFYRSIQGHETFRRVMMVEQGLLRTSPISVVATYTGIFDVVRNLFSMTKGSRELGYTPARFSFLDREGRCERCGGEGERSVDMHFLPDLKVVCEVCGGRRYNRATLAIRYRGKGIDEVLDLEIEEAVHFFSGIRRLERMLRPLIEGGLGYLKLGQALKTLSTGEMVRLRIARELMKGGRGEALYIIDEPALGLHPFDKDRLMGIFTGLIAKGHTVVLIDQDRDLLCSSDYLLELGPSAGEDGGRIVRQGFVKEI